MYRVTTKPQLLSELCHQCLGRPVFLPSTRQVSRPNSLPGYNRCTHAKHATMKKYSMPLWVLHRTRHQSYWPLAFILTLASYDTHPMTSVLTKVPMLLPLTTETAPTFCQPSKSPPVSILERLLAVHGLKEGPRFLRMDQGGELWGSAQLRDIANASGYIIEPTGSDPSWQNGKVECLNGTFGVMVRCLLYSAGLSVKFRSTTLIHAVYLNNRLYHKAIGKTPYEGWTGIKPDLDHLLTFGALVTARIPGKRPAKADRHTAHGVLLGFGSSTKHVR
jgi:hypothetical protein